MRDRRLRFLLIEDNPGDAELVREYLAESRQDWELSVVERPAEAAEALDQADYELVLTDLGLPESQGIDSFFAVREIAGEVPILVLTGLADAALGRRAVAEGAQDYLVKGDLSPALLSRSIEYALERHRLAREAERREEVARQADRMAVIGRVVGGVAHEFNNLLTAVQGYAQLLESDPALDAEQRENVAEILAASKRASGITRQLLAYSRRQILSPARFDLNGALDEMRTLLESTLGRRFVLRYELADGPLAVHADRAQVEHALMHLLSNARNAMPDGGQVEISTRLVSVGDEGGPLDLAPGDYVMLGVHDDGPGISPGTLEIAREPFFTSRPFGEALGLGLATVDGIADQSGGALEIESEVGGGTTARIYLPKGDGEVGSET